MKNWRAVAAKLCGWVAGAFVAAMMLLTVADVAMRAIANRPIRGTLELIELLLACSFFLALPATFLRDENIVVDVIDGIAPRRVPMLRRIAEVLAVALLAVMAWQGWLAARDTILFNDVTSDLALPKILYWIPVLAGIIGAAVAALMMALRGNDAR
jgi:TRAP-type C4-dicarboxylate transport system permease small subunit